jgi:predicted phage terminase large subunit-like protein
MAKKTKPASDIDYIKPQPGPQTMFLETAADIAIYGGAAGGGKSYALLLEVLRHYNNPQFGAVIFRRTTPQIRNEGGLWDESLTIYGPLGASASESHLEWEFDSGCRVKFAHLEHEKSVYSWQGSQIPMIGFDELTHFTMQQFFYMLSRNRSTCGVPAYIRCTTNPDPDSWVAEFISWWIDQKTGYPIPERNGKIRYFVRVRETIYWGDSAAELKKKHGDNVKPKSVTFISAKLSDNKILEEKDPSYRANLEAMTLVDRERLLEGNWKIKATAGNVFKAEYFPVIDAVPAGWIAAVRYWDRAGTKPGPGNPDPDWTRGLKLLRYPNGTYVVADLRSARDTPGPIEGFIKNVASYDGPGVRIRSQQDPGSAGKTEGAHFIRMLAGFDVAVEVLTKNKFARAKPVAAQCQAGNVRVVRASWNKDFFDELEAFSSDPGQYKHDDIVDVLSGGFNSLATDRTAFDSIETLNKVF